MKKITTIVAVTLMAALFAMTGPAFGGEVNVGKKGNMDVVTPGSEFSALKDVPAAEMSGSEMKEVVGKHPIRVDTRTTWILMQTLPYSGSDIK